MTDLSQADDADLENEALAKLVKGTKLNGSKFQLRPYQKADIKFMASANSINANQPGAGKTIETIGAVMEADLAWGQHLIVAPVTSLQLVWEKELAQAYKLAGLDEPTILTGATPKERKAAVAEAKRMADEGLAFWLVLNPAMTRLKRQKVEGTTGDAIEYEEVLAHPELAEVTWDTITVDEFHLMGLSNPTTLGAQGINRIVELTDEGDQRRFALSGTPMGGKPVKLLGSPPVSRARQVHEPLELGSSLAGHQPQRLRPQHRGHHARPRGGFLQPPQAVPRPPHQARGAAGPAAQAGRSTSGAT